MEARLDKSYLTRTTKISSSYMHSTYYEMSYALCPIDVK